MLLRQLPGIASVLLGAFVLIGESLIPRWLEQHAAPLSYMGLNSALCFVLAGLALQEKHWLDVPAKKWDVVLGFVILVIGVAAILQSLIGFYPTGNIWRYLVNVEGNANEPGVWPGVMGHASAAAFVFCGTILVLLGLATNAASRLMIQTLLSGMVAISLVGLCSAILGNVLFYEAGPGHTMMNLQTALGLMVLAFGLILRASMADWLRDFYRGREGLKIFTTGIALLSLVALLTGLTAIAIVGRYAMSTYQDAMLAEFRSNVELFHSSVETEVNRGSELIALSRLARLVDEGASGAALQSEVDRILKVGGERNLNALWVADANGHALAERRVAGIGYTEDFSAPVASRLPVRLFWHDGWRLLLKVPLVSDKRGEVGSASMIVNIRRFNALYTRLNQTGRSHEARICAPEGEGLRCFPSRFNDAVRYYRKRPALNWRNSPAMEQAMAGKSGVAGSIDHRGKDVVAAYGPLGDMGLGMAQEIDLEEFYEPLRQQLWLALFGVLALIQAGAAVLYWRTRPLIRGMVHARARLNAILDNVPAGVVITDSDGMIESANRTAEFMLGHEPGMLAGTHIGDMFSPDAENVRWPAVGLHMVDMRRKNGSTFPAELVSSEFMLGKERRQIAILLDMTERRKMGILLRKWEHLFEHVDWGVGIGDPNGEWFESMNPAFARMHGYTVDELLARPIISLFPPEEQGRIPKIVHLSNTVGRYSFESVHVRKDGSTFPVWIDVTAIKDEQGRVLCRAVNVLDISDRKRMEQKLRQSEQLLRNVLDALPVGVWVTDAHGAVVMANPAAAKIHPRLESVADEYAGATGNPGTVSVIGHDPCETVIRQVLEEGWSQLGIAVDIDNGDGKRKTLRTSVVPLLDERGNVTGVVAVNEDVTQAQRAERALKKSEASLANAQRIARLGNWDVDLVSGELYCSGEVSRIFGLPPQSGKPRLRTLLARLAPPDRKRLLSALRDALRGRGYIDAIYRLAMDDGGMKSVHVQVDVVFDADGRALGMSGIVHDVTEKLEAIDLLRKQGEQFRALVENSPDLIARFDRDAHCIYANPAVEQVVGMRYAQIVGRLPDDLNLPEEVASLGMDSIKKVFVTRLADTFDFSLPTSTGIRHYQARVVPEFGADGIVQKVLVVARDISVIKGGEAILRESEQRLHGITSNIPGMVFQCLLRASDGTLRFTYVSEGSVPLLGLTPGQVQADRHALPNSIVDVDREAFRASLQQSATNMTVWNWEGRLMNAQGERWINCRATPRLTGSGEVVWEGVMFNISDSKRSEQEIRQSRQSLRELSAHMESVREEERKRIAREVHDELGQALTALRMDVSMLRLGFAGQSPQLAERIQSMKELVDRTIQIVRHVTSTLRPAALDLGLTAAIEWLVEDFVRRVGIACELNTDGCEIVLDDSRSTALFRIVQESLMNVVKHAEASRVEVSIWQQPGYVCIEVRDNGKGFTPEASRKRGSFGLVGMRERTLMIGGKLDISSVTGEGTRVTVCVPFEPDESDKTSASNEAIT